MSKKLDPDFRALKMCVKALTKVSTPRMVRPTLEYLIDRFILHPREARQEERRKRIVTALSAPSTTKG
jgi:hypothetical protein